MKRERWETCFAHLEAAERRRDPGTARLGGGSVMEVLRCSSVQSAGRGDAGGAPRADDGARVASVEFNNGGRLGRWRRLDFMAKGLARGRLI
jgi:hypothetical protein